MQKKTLNPTWDVDYVVTLKSTEVSPSQDLVTIAPPALTSHAYAPQLLLIEVLDWDRITKNDCMGGFLVLPEWYIPAEFEDAVDNSPAVGHCGSGFKRKDEWWKL